MGIVSKGSICDVEDCEEVAIRSLNTKKVEDAGLRVNSSGKKTALCKKCYKEWKKATKEDRSLERARYDRG
jgi:thymidine kinase|tara:strand:- start:327 stop:539 length:213 start_codon:yes stop_codon:yes gene_type:complete